MAILYTPYRFTPEVVRNEVPPDTAGSYVLGDSRGDGLFVPQYVGRSGADVQERLRGHNHLYKYEYFVFRQADSPKEAFRQECEFWHGHRQRGYDLDNRVHPAVPDGQDARCPFCSFAEHMSALSVDP